MDEIEPEPPVPVSPKAESAGPVSPKIRRGDPLFYRPLSFPTPTRRLLNFDLFLPL
jgi:hypothetical protein